MKLVGLGMRAGEALYLAVGGTSVRVFDVRTGEEVQKWKSQRHATFAKIRRFLLERYLFAATSIDPTQLVYIYKDYDTPYNALAIKDPDGRITVYGEHKWEFVQPLAEARQSSRGGHVRHIPLIRSIVSADEDNTVRIWKSSLTHYSLQDVESHSLKRYMFCGLSFRI